MRKMIGLTVFLLLISITGAAFMLNGASFEDSQLMINSNLSSSSEAGGRYDLCIDFIHEEMVEVSIFESVSETFSLVFVTALNPFNSTIDSNDLLWYMDHCSHLVYPVIHDSARIIQYYPIYYGLSYIMVVFRNETSILEVQSSFIIRADTVVPSSQLLDVDGSFHFIHAQSLVEIELENWGTDAIYRVDLNAGGNTYSHYEIMDSSSGSIFIRFDTYDLEEQEYTCTVKIYSIDVWGTIHTMISQPFIIRIFFQREYVLNIGLCFVMIGICGTLYLSMNVWRATIYGVKHGLRVRMQQSQENTRSFPSSEPELIPEGPNLIQKNSEVI